jgi:hypothetical protein
MNTIILVIYLIILFAIAHLIENNKKETFLYNETVVSNLYNIHKETDLNNGFIGVHPNIFKKSKNREYHITSKYNFNLTVDEKRELRRIVNPIIKQINKDLKLEFHFVDFEHVTTQYFKDKNKRLIIDFFMHETNKYYDKRLVADVILYTNKKSVYVNNLTIGNGNIEKTSNNIALPNFNNKIITDANLKNTNTVIGNENNTLDYEILKDKPTSFIGSNRNFTEWVLSNKDTPYQKQDWPCRKQGEKWNSNSIMNTEKKTGKCKGVNNTFREQVQKPEFNPSFKITEQKGNHNWLWGESSGTGNMFRGG